MKEGADIGKLARVTIVTTMIMVAIAVVPNAKPMPVAVNTLAAKLTFFFCSNFNSTKIATNTKSSKSNYGDV